MREVIFQFEASHGDGACEWYEVMITDLKDNRTDERYINKKMVGTPHFKIRDFTV